MRKDADVVFLRRITPRGLLSFGSDHPGLELRSLNVLIGPNASGKSNLIELIALLRATHRDLREVIRKGGGISEWIWKGAGDDRGALECILSAPLGRPPLRHTLEFSAQGGRFALLNEQIEEASDPAHDDSFFYRYQQGHPVIRLQADHEHRLAQESVEADRSILAQRKDPEHYPELFHLAEQYERIRIYREAPFGRNSACRIPQSADARNDFLEEDFSNLGLNLSRLKSRFPAVDREIRAALQDLSSGLVDVNVLVEGGTVQIFFTDGDFVIPAARASDGTLRTLCLLTILLDPTPPPLICIEEPELGLHPDLLPKLADRLREAATRTQLIITTHSDILVDAMTECAEAIVVCEKPSNQTTTTRLSAALPHRLERYS